MDNLFSLQNSILLLLGVVLLAGFYMGQVVKKIQLPSIIGFMLLGLIFGPSCLGIISEKMQENFSFITEIALGFVAFSIGLELSMSSLKSQGMGIISIILAESFAAFLVVAGGLYLLTGDLPVSLIFGALAPASAPAGTVAVIKEFKAKGSLTKALYAVVGFDDGLAIIIFGFAAATVRTLLQKEVSGGDTDFLQAMLPPIKEIVFSIAIGALLSVIFSVLSKKLKNSHDVLILIVAFVMITNGICVFLHLSLILTNMIMGLVIVNTQRHELVRALGEQLSNVMPLFFVLFFALAGAHLQISALPALGWIGVVYILCRSAGLIGGARLGGALGHVEDKVKKYVGLGILSQAGVAIGLGLSSMSSKASARWSKQSMDMPSPQATYWEPQL